MLVLVLVLVLVLALMPVPVPRLASPAVDGSSKASEREEERANVEAPRDVFFLAVCWAESVCVCACVMAMGDAGEQAEPLAQRQAGRQAGVEALDNGT